MSQLAIDIDVNLPIDVNLVCHSPHVVAYRMWQRVPGAAQWDVVAEGHTADEKPDHAAAGPFPAGWKFAYHLIIAGNASTDFIVTIALSQEGRSLAGGTFVEKGTVDATKRAVRDRKVVLI